MSAAMTNKNFMAIAGVLVLGGLASCGGDQQRTTALEQRVDSLQAQIAHAYKPGLGEFMSGIQVHHVKLWSAGSNANWKLADFEVHEIMESLDDIKAHAGDRKETASLGMLDPALDSVNAAIVKQDTALFRSSYLLLTRTCNSCHQATDHGFNVIKLPTAPPFSDQEFAPVL